VIAVFTPPCIVSNMLHIFVVITPVDVNGAEYYKVRSCARDCIA
jgi:hypothetical protein